MFVNVFLYRQVFHMYVHVSLCELMFVCTWLHMWVHAMCMCMYSVYMHVYVCLSVCA